MFILASSIPTWLSTCGTTHHIALLLSSSPFTIYTDHLLHIRTIFDILVEVANVTANLLVGL